MSPTPQLPEGPSAGWVGALAGIILAIITGATAVMAAARRLAFLDVLQAEWPAHKEKTATIATRLQHFDTDKFNQMAHDLDAMQAAMFVAEKRKDLWMDSVDAQLHDIISRRDRWLAAHPEMRMPE